MVTGYGTISTRTPHSLTLLLEPRGASTRQPRVPLLSAATQISVGQHTGTGSTVHLAVGQQVYFTASAERARRACGAIRIVVL